MKRMAYERSVFRFRKTCRDDLSGKQIQHNTEVELTEDIDYSDTDLRSILEGERRYGDQEESFGNYGYQEQEFRDGELVDVEDDEEEDEGDRIAEEMFDDFDSSYDEE